MNNDHGRYITIRELRDTIRAFRWEVRFWIIVAVVASPNIPIRNLTAYLVWWR
jgi:hypothetical protein